MRRRRPFPLAAALSALALIAGCGVGHVRTVPDAGATRAAAAAGEFTRVDGIVTTASVGAGAGLDRWRREVPAIEDVRIPSSADDHEQGVLWLPPRGAGKPLLVVLHSWSYGYLQHAGIPFGRWAARYGWGMIHPDYRGRFASPQATGSDLAVQDVLDAVDFAIEEGAAEEGSVDSDRVFVVGFSGGGMMALLMAGRHPERFAGVVSWVPIHDLVEWHAYSAERQPRYANEIRASCGGDPGRDTWATLQCRRRSPETHLDAAREAGLPVYIGHGAGDTVVPPAHALKVFNQLADPEDRLPDDLVAAAARTEVADELRGQVEAESYFDDEDPAVVFSRRSGPVTLVLFEGEHDMVYHPGLRWMLEAALRASPTGPR